MTLATAHYSSPGNAIGLVGRQLGGNFLITTNVYVDQMSCRILINWILIQIETQRTLKSLKLPSIMPIYSGKNTRYAHLAEICKKMRQRAKYAAIAYSRKTDMPIWITAVLVWLAYHYANGYAQQYWSTVRVIYFTLEKTSQLMVMVKNGTVLHHYPSGRQKPGRTSLYV